MSSGKYNRTDYFIIVAVTLQAITSSIPELTWCPIPKLWKRIQDTEHVKNIKNTQGLEEPVNLEDTLKKQFHENSSGRNVQFG